jgi:hypothetical protein
MKDDRGFRFLVGCFVLFAAYQLYANDVFGLWSSGDDQVESVDLVGLAIQSLISAVDGAGYVAILLVSGLWPLVATSLERLQGAFTKKPAIDLDDPAVREMLAKLIADQGKDDNDR